VDGNKEGKVLVVEMDAETLLDLAGEFLLGNAKHLADAVSGINYIFAFSEFHGIPPEIVR
jgi:hypothetical protein